MWCNRRLLKSSSQSLPSSLRATHTPAAFRSVSAGTACLYEFSSGRLAALRREQRSLGFSQVNTRTRSHASAEEQSSAANAADPGTSAATQPAPDSAASTSTSSSTTSSNGISGISVLTSTEPIDRLRYQAMLVFDHWDTAKTGRLTGQQLEQFFIWCAKKESWSPGLSEVLQQVSMSYAHMRDIGCSRDEFIRIIRQQIHAVSTSAAYQSSMMRPDVSARLQTQMSLNKQELAAAKWMFGLLDFDNDGKVALSMYKDAQGIEAYVYEDKIEDADADDDGFVVFEEFLGSYARPKPIGKNLVIMAVNTLAIFLILQAPFLDTMIKVVLVGVLFVKPQIISRPAALVYDAIKALIDQGKAQAELAKQNRGVWRPT